MHPTRAISFAQCMAIVMAMSCATWGQTRTARAAELPSEPVVPVSFENDVVPILTRFGCNAGACHGKARGQNGFQLSLLGFYPDFDYAAITQEARGRRVFPAVPEKSLLLAKASGLTPHGGGKRIEPHG